MSDEECAYWFNKKKLADYIAQQSAAAAVVLQYTEWENVWASPVFLHGGAQWRIELVCNKNYDVVEGHITFFSRISPRSHLTPSHFISSSSPSRKSLGIINNWICRSQLFDFVNDYLANHENPVD